MKKAFAAFIAMLFLISAFAIINDHGGDKNQISAFVSEKDSGNRVYNLEKIAEKRGVPLRYISPPAAMPDTNYADGVIEPSYNNAPAPFGIGFYGTENINGRLTGFNLTTPGIMASIKIYNMSDFYLLNDGPESETFQLNAVLSNVTLFGKSGYSFWTQNVAFYSARTHQLQFLVNIWNFSSPAINFTANSISYHSSGFVCAPTFYYAVGPTINVTAPFTLNLYMNSGIVNNDSAVFFNYSVKTASMNVSGTYDEVLFNSTRAVINPEYLASGTQLTPTGYIPYDFEIIIGGPGGGSTTSLYNINATMNLKYLYNKSYKNVPSAYDVGSETGETSDGIAISWHGATEHLTTGPSFVYGMWNISNNDRMEKFSGRIEPSNAFAFVSPGCYFNESLASWLPLSINGSYNYELPADHYSGISMLSYYAPAYYLEAESHLIKTVSMEYTRLCMHLITSS
ncbi:thermopsin family protease [Picrophilus oshimae]|uniref:thermopsin family protease n=1 Tax=Picrophilus oshimae TaxID=46632 RepID=UPI001F2147F1|nr:thermopsin family protease [Picrophilus oshimae]